MTDKEHQYSEEAPRDVKRVGVVMESTCSRCSGTRQRIQEPLHPRGYVTTYRMTEDGRISFGADLPCTPVQKLLSLARSREVNEAAVAATKAVKLMGENDLVFYPSTALLQTAVATYGSARTDDERRAAALALVRASHGLLLVTSAESIELRRNDAPKKKKEMLGRVREAMGKVGQLGREVVAAFSGQIEIADGVTIGDRGDKIVSELADLERDVLAFREELSSIFGEPKKKTKARARQQPPRKSAPPRKTKAVATTSRTRKGKSRR